MNRRNCVNLLVTLLMVGCGVGDEAGSPGEARLDAGSSRDAPPGAPSFSAPPGVDSSFGSGGLFVIPVKLFFPNDIAIQPDGRIVIVGTAFDDSSGAYAAYVLRLRRDGSLDPGFAAGGIFRFPLGEGAAAVTVAGSGEIVLGGGSDLGGVHIWRMRSDGAMDTSFGTRGRVEVGSRPAAIEHLAVELDGAIRGTGTSQLGKQFVVRLLADGTLDPAHHTALLALGDVTAKDSILAPDHSWISVASLVDYRKNVFETYLMRIRPDGSRDESMGPDGLLSVDARGGGVIAADGPRLYLGLTNLGASASSSLSWVEARGLDGRIDDAFGAGGRRVLGSQWGITDMFVQTDGSLSVVTLGPNLELHRLGRDGAIRGEPWIWTLPESHRLGATESALDGATGDIVIVAALANASSHVGTGVFRVSR